MELYGSLAFDTLRLAKLWKLAPHKSPASHIQHSKCFSINHQLSEINSLLRFFTQKPKGITEKKVEKQNQFSWMKYLSMDRSGWDWNVSKIALRSESTFYCSRYCVIKEIKSGVREWEPSEEINFTTKRNLKKVFLGERRKKFEFLLKNL